MKKISIMAACTCVAALSGCGNVGDYVGNKLYKDDNPNTVKASIHKHIDARWEKCEEEQPNNMAACMEPDTNTPFVQCLLKAKKRYPASEDAFESAYEKCEDQFTEDGS